jgi:predicted RNA-binding Zn-ribbon protein involved in translation (DUF1610 family)
MADTNPSTLHSTSKAEFACPDCGEMVREGLVRCWNCGGFLRPEMERKFQKMQQQPPKVILSTAAEPDADNVDLDAMMTTRVEEAEGEDDFQISTPVRKVEAPTIDTGGESSAEDSSAAAGAETAVETETKAPAATQDQAPSTGPADGDALMELAAAEEQERQQRQGSRPAGLEGVKAIRDGFLIDAPKGCRIQIRDERTGEMRRLTFGASSRVRISMLDKLEAIAKARKEAAEKQPEGPKHLSAGKYQRWMKDLHLHTINPAKLKLIPDSLTKEFVTVDAGFAEDELLLASLPAAKKSLFGGGKGPASTDEARQALLAHLRAGKSLDGEKVEVAGDVKTRYSADQIAELRVVQPAASLSESLFAGIPVFGEGRIAIQLPVKERAEQPKVLSFTLSQFREFVDIVGPLYSMTEFGHNLGIPLTDTFENLKCHYSGEPIKALENITFYDADPELETVLIGYKCEACGIAVSEVAREKEKLGGKGGKGIAKAKCPKCEQKMGNVPLYTLKEQAMEPSTQGETPDDDPGEETAKAPPAEEASKAEGPNSTPELATKVDSKTADSSSG